MVFSYVGGNSPNFCSTNSMGIHVNNDVNIHDREIIIVVLDSLSTCLVLPPIFACVKLGQTLRNKATSRCFAFSPS